MDKEDFNERILDLLKIEKKARKQGANIDTNPKITVKHQARPCDDCDQMVVGRTLEFYVRYPFTERAHWIKSCSECKRKEPI